MNGIGAALFLFVLYCMYVVVIGPLLVVVGAVVMFGHVVVGTIGGLATARNTAPSVPQADGEDPAFRSYFLGQGRSDLVWTARTIFDTIAEVTDWLVAAHEDAFDESWYLTWPLILGHLVGALVGLVVIGAALVAQAIAMAIGFVLAELTRVALRSSDWVLGRIRRVRVVCPHPGCNHPIAYPGYRCPQCDSMHADVRPSRLGIAARTCRCGERMPTLVLLGSAHGKATCVHCLRPLEKTAGTMREVQVPVLGATSAGKSGFLGATFNALMADTGNRITRVRAAESSAASVQDLSGRAAAGMQLDPTGDHIPAAMQLYIEPTKGRELAVHFFDPAGELLRGDEDTMDQLGFLGHADRFVLVLDPLALPSVLEQLEPVAPDAVAAAAPTHEDQEQAFHNSVQRIAGRAKKGRLAFIVTKLDVLEGARALDGLDGTDSASVAAWLERHELGNLVRAARNGFSTVRFYGCSAVRPDGGAGLAALIDPVAWLLDLQATTPAPALAGVSAGATP